jgi:hypothetical protein
MDVVFPSLAESPDFEEDGSGVDIASLDDGETSFLGGEEGKDAAGLPCNLRASAFALAVTTLALLAASSLAFRFSAFAARKIRLGSDSGSKF